MFKVVEFPDVWADACIRDSDGRFMFLSVYGRDVSLMQFLAAMELAGKERGINRFTLVGSDERKHSVDVAGTDRLAKHSVRLPKQNLFGPISQMWIFDKGVQEVDRVNRIGYALNIASKERRDGRQELTKKAWQLIKNLSPVALLDHWQLAVLDWCMSKEAVTELGTTLYPVLGNVGAMRVSLSDYFVEFISEGVRTGVLTLEPSSIHQA
ncbi:hypothetical protein [Comamonas jiangduensis]|uniref:hypothetical protein n=1 Tax=Comamonas jiangduensis TaxID=1194168 RepID=UPI003BF82698